MPEDVKENLESVKKQLTIKHIALCKVPHEEMHMLDPLDKEWTNEVKKLSYDIDDMVDRFFISTSRSRVENGTGKSRTDRLRLPFKPTVNRFRKKMGKWENKTGKRVGTGTVGVFSRPFSRFLFSAGKIPAGIPVFIVVGCVTCVGNVNYCLHVFQREL